MRAVVTGLLLLLLAGADAAQADVALPLPNCTASPLVLCKKIVIYNNTHTTTKPTRLFVVLQRGNELQDNWLVALAQTVDPTLNPANKYGTTKVYRYYVNCCTSANSPTDGIGPGESVEISVPYYTQLKSGDSSTDLDHYVDWWNGNRIFFYDDQAQNFNNYTNDVQVQIPGGLTPTFPCVKLGGGACNNVTIRFTNVGLPDSDRSQLMEYTFAAAVTGETPYHLYLGQVGYNISSVDQVYLPTSMQPLNNPIPFIGTTTDIVTFRASLQKFLKTFKGWPIYNTTDFDRPRIPSPNIIFSSSTLGPDNKVIFSPSSHLALPTDPSTQKPITGPALSNMVTLYQTCRDKPNESAFCTTQYPPNPPGYNYKQTIDFFTKNFNDYINKFLTPNGPCTPLQPYPWVTSPDLTKMARLYGWVPFNDGCTDKTANDLLLVTDNGDKKDFAVRQVAYIHGLQYSPNNP